VPLKFAEIRPGCCTKWRQQIESMRRDRIRASTVQAIQKLDHAVLLNRCQRPTEGQHPNANGDLGTIDGELLPLLAEAGWRPTEALELTEEMVSYRLWDAIRPMTFWA
jgi:hypothetical protein